MEPPVVRIGATIPNQVQQLAHTIGAQEVKLATEVSWSACWLKPKIVNKLANKLAKQVANLDSRLTSVNLIPIIEWVSRAPLDTYVHAKKNFASGISFYALSHKKKIASLLIADPKEIVGSGAEVKVVKAIHIYFKFKKEKFYVNGEAVKLTGLLTKPYHIEHATSRIQVQKAFGGEDGIGIAQISLSGAMAGKFGPKFITFMHRFNGGNFLEYVRSISLNKKDPQKNFETALVLGRLICNCLQRTHLQFIHRDVKWENFLIEYENPSAAQGARHIKRFVLTDFGTAVSLDVQDPRWNTSCGTLEFLPPEILCKDLGCEKEIYELLGIQDRLSIRTSKLDAWPVGLMLHYLFYGKYPPCVAVLEPFIKKNREVQELKAKNPPEAELRSKREELKKVAQEVKDKWIAEIKTLHGQDLPYRGAMELAIYDLLRPAPKRRSNLQETRSLLG